MLKYLKKFLKYLEQWEIYERSSFWFCIIGVWVTIKSFAFAFGALSPVSELPCQSQAIVCQVRAGGSSERVSIKNIDSDLHRRLERHFPDWEERMAYQEKQAEFYKSALRKKNEIIRLRIIDDSSLYSKKELDSINYFKGKGCYAKHQDLSVARNISK